MYMQQYAHKQTESISDCLTCTQTGGVLSSLIFLSSQRNGVKTDEGSEGLEGINV